MKKFNKVLKYKMWDVVPYLFKDNTLGNNVLLLIDPTKSNGEQYIANCSAYVKCCLNDNEVLIKNYSENTNMLEWLMENEVVSSPIDTIDNGYATFPICAINLDNFIDIHEIL